MRWAQDRTVRPGADERAALRERTRDHYERMPFLEGGPARVDKWTRRAARDLPHLTSGPTVLDVGCGSGEVAEALRGTGSVVICLDLTASAAARAQGRGLPTTRGDALSLPFPDQAVDHVLAMGVMHHTPDCRAALAEAARVSSVTVTTLLYSWGSPYHLVYLVLGRPLSRRDPGWLERLPRSLLLLARGLLRLATRIPLNDEQARRVIADQLCTPRATFHAPRHVRRWARELGMEVVRRKRVFGYSNLFVLGHQEPGGMHARLRQATLAHYEAFPFIEGGDRRVRHWQRRLAPVLTEQVGDELILDAGCGSGEIGEALTRDGGNVVLLDLTSAVGRAARRTGLPGVRGDVLHLPFRDGAFNRVVSIGVLHHTPDCRAGLHELFRVSRGPVTVLIYTPWTPNHLVYTLLAPLRTRVPTTTLHRLPRASLSAMRVVVALQGRGWLEDDQLRRLVADQLWTPQATFHRPSQLDRWADDADWTTSIQRRLFAQAVLMTFRPGSRLGRGTVEGLPD